MKKKRGNTEEPRIVELVKTDYQPKKAEIEEEFTLRKRDGSRASVEDLSRAVLRPIKARWIDKPR